MFNLIMDALDSADVMYCAVSHLSAQRRTYGGHSNDSATCNGDDKWVMQVSSGVLLLLGRENEQPVMTYTKLKQPSSVPSPCMVSEVVEQTGSTYRKVNDNDIITSIMCNSILKCCCIAPAVARKRKVILCVVVLPGKAYTFKSNVNPYYGCLNRNGRYLLFEDDFGDDAGEIALLVRYQLWTIVNRWVACLWAIYSFAWDRFFGRYGINLFRQMFRYRQDVSLFL